MKKISLVFILLIVLISPVLADQTVTKIVDVRDLPYEYTFEVPINGTKGDVINIDTTDWLKSRLKEYEIGETGVEIIYIDLLVPNGVELGNYTEKIYLWNVNRRSEITINVLVKKLIKRSEITVRLLNLYTSNPIENSTIIIYTPINNSQLTDNNGYAIFKSVDEGCWDVYITASNYSDRSAYLCSVGKTQNYIYYLSQTGKTNLSKEEEVLAYRNSLAEHEAYIQSKSEFSGGFSINGTNETCPKIVDFNMLEKQLNDCEKARDLYYNMSLVSANTNIVVDSDKQQAYKYLKMIGVGLAIVFIISLIIWFRIKTGWDVGVDNG